MKPPPIPKHLKRMSCDELVQLWRRITDTTEAESRPPERELAGIEAAILAKMPTSARGGEKDSSVYLAKLFSTDEEKHASSRFERRARLYAIGKHGDPLWERVEKSGMTLSTAIRLFRDARKLARGKPFGFSRGIAMILDEYDKLDGHDSETKFGVVRRKKRNRLRTVEDLAAKHGENGAPKDWSGRDAFAKIRDACSEYVNESLSAFDSNELGIQRKKLSADVEIFLFEFRTRVHSLKQRAGELDGYMPTAVGKVSRRKLLDACTIMQMDPPRPGKSVDDKYATKRMKSRARILHPDASGTEETRTAFEELMQAYALIKLYNEGLAAPPPEEETGENHVRE